MDRINGAATVDIGGGRQGFRSEDLPTGTEGTEVTDEWLNAVQENILKVIEEAGLALDVNDWSLLWQAIRFAQMSDGYFSVTDQRNDPPAGPAIGDRYIVGAAPTGDWVGNVNKIALWLGVWTFIDPKPWMHVGLADKTDWRWDHTADPAAWINWFASGEEAADETITGRPIDPSSLWVVLDELQANPIGMRANSAGIQSIPHYTPALVNDWVIQAGESNVGENLYAAGVVTIKEPGLYIISTVIDGGSGGVGVYNDIILRRKRGGTTTNVGIMAQAGAPGAGTILFLAEPVRLQVDDEISVYYSQHSGSPATITSNSHLSYVRV